MGFKNDLTGKDFLRFVVPTIVVNMFMSLYAIVDGFFVSKYVGSNALASINLIIPINTIIYAVGLMFVSGGCAFASIKLGEGDKAAASKFFSNLLSVAIGFAIVVMALALLFKGQLLNFIGVNDDLYPYASVYIVYCVVTLPLLITKMIFAGFLRAEGNPKISLKMSVLGGVINMILDYVFIVILDMGIAGAGLATLLGIVTAVIYAGRYFASQTSIFKFKLAPIDAKLLKDTMINGSSEMVSELAVGFTAFVLNTLTLKYLGNDGVAAIAVVLYINFFASMAFQGFAVGIAPLLSYYYGAKNLTTLKKVRGYARNTLLIISPILVAFILLNRSMLVSIFFDSANPVHAIASNGLFVFSFAFFVMGFNFYGSGMYTAFSNGKISAIIAFSKTFIFFLAGAYLLPKLLGSNGIWLISPAAEIVTAAIVCFLTREKQLERLANLQPVHMEKAENMQMGKTAS